MEINFLSPTKFEINSGNYKVISDQPKSTGGTAEGMQPVDLLLASLGSCIAVFISHLLVRRNIDLSACRLMIDKEMADNPRRVGKISVKLDLPDNITDSDKKAILRSASHCTVHNTLHGNPQINVDII